MFDNIIQLENEVKEFEKNMLASKELVQRIEAIIKSLDSAQNQNAEELLRIQKALQAQMTENERIIREAESVLSKKNEERLEAFTAEAKESLKSLCEQQREQMDALRLVIEHTAAENKQESNAAVTAFKDSAKELAQKQEDLYKLFRSAQLEQVYSQIQSLEKKLTLLLASIIAVGVLTVVSIIL